MKYSFVTSRFSTAHFLSNHGRRMKTTRASPCLCSQAGRHHEHGNAKASSELAASPVYLRACLSDYPSCPMPNDVWVQNSARPFGTVNSCFQLRGRWSNSGEGGRGKWITWVYNRKDLRATVALCTCHRSLLWPKLDQIAFEKVRYMQESQVGAAGLQANRSLALLLAVYERSTNVDHADRYRFLQAAVVPVSSTVWTCAKLH